VAFYGKSSTDASALQALLATCIQVSTKAGLCRCAATTATTWSHFLEESSLLRQVMTSAAADRASQAAWGSTGDAATEMVSEVRRGEPVKAVEAKTVFALTHRSSGRCSFCRLPPLARVHAEFWSSWPAPPPSRCRLGDCADSAPSFERCGGRHDGRPRMGINLQRFTAR